MFKIYPFVEAIPFPAAHAVHMSQPSLRIVDDEFDDNIIIDSDATLAGNVLFNSDLIVNGEVIIDLPPGWSGG